MISIKELSSLHVACLTYHPTAGSSEMHAQIGACFRSVKDWVSQQGFDPLAELTI
jgi:hypothetical protein